MQLIFRVLNLRLHGEVEPIILQFFHLIITKTMKFAPYENNPLYNFIVDNYIRGYLDLDYINPYLKFVFSFSEDLLELIIVITGSVAVIKTFHNSLYLHYVNIYKNR